MLPLLCVYFLVSCLLCATSYAMDEKDKKEELPRKKSLYLGYQKTSPKSALLQSHEAINEILLKEKPNDFEKFCQKVFRKKQLIKKQNSFVDKKEKQILDTQTIKQDNFLESYNQAKTVNYLLSIDDSFTLKAELHEILDNLDLMNQLKLLFNFKDNAVVKNFIEELRKEYVTE